MTVNIHIRGVDPDLWARFRSAAVLRRLSVGALLNQLIREWLARTK